MSPDAPSSRSMRSVLSLGALVLAGFALVAALTVIALSTLLHRVSAVVETSTQGVRVAVETEVDLLLHAQANSPIVRRDLAGRIQRRLTEIAAYVGTEHEQAVLTEAKARVNEYLVASRDEGRPAEELTKSWIAAYTTLDELANINVAQGREEAARANRIDYVASVGGFALAILVLGAAAFFIYWIRGPLIRPVLELGRAMNEFGRGDLAVRVRPSGPRELKEMAARFNEMATQIERQREKQRAFLAGVAHDLRNPLNAVILSTEAARRDPTLPSDHRGRRVLDASARQLHKLDRMISDFLDAAAIETGQLELRLQHCDLRDVVRSATELFVGTSSRHELVVSVPSEPVESQVDPLRIEQVISNLISNAIKYSPKGGRVEIWLERLGSESLVAVKDYGLGMSVETQAQVFESFRRGLATEGIPGAGLGLFIVRRIVEAHQGRIEVESAPGRGSTFRVFLPLSPEQAGGQALPQGVTS